MANKPKSGVSKVAFWKELNTTLRKRKESNSPYLTKAKYNALIRQVKAENKKNKGKNTSPCDNFQERSFDIVREKKRERLIVPSRDKRLKGKLIYYITKDEIYDIINNIHLKTNHGSKNVVIKYLNARYKNITYESVNIYLSLCKVCKERSQAKAKEPARYRKPAGKKCSLCKGNRKGTTKTSSQCQCDGDHYIFDKEVKQEDAKSDKAVLSNKNSQEVASRGMLNEVKPRGTFYFIDMQEEPDGEYRYIIVYEDEVTKFVQLKALKSKEVGNIAAALLEVFTTFGTPCVLQSGSDEQTAIEITNLLKDKGQQVKHEKVSLEEPNNEINKILYCWLCRSATYKWSEGLRFIQYIRNITYNEKIKKTPFEAMFGRKGKLDVSSLNLPQEVIGDIRSEEDTAFPDSHDNMNIIEINNMLEVVMDVSD